MKELYMKLIGFLKFPIRRDHYDGEQRNCYNCKKCTYLSEGGYICEDSLDIVFELWEETEKFNSCKGKKFEKI